VHQGMYTKDILKKFDMGEAKPLLTIMSTTTALDVDEDDKPMDQKEYKQDWLPPILDCAEARYTLCSVSMRLLPSFPTHFSQTGCETDYEVHVLHSLVWFMVLFFIRSIFVRLFGC
jgi:hypothetical protein